jgi:putative transposase
VLHWCERRAITPWSSYRANALGGADPIITPHAVYCELAPSEEARRGAYCRLFEDELSAETLQRLRECTNGGFVLGSSKLEQQIAVMLGRWTWKGSLGPPPKKAVGEEQQQLPF